MSRETHVTSPRWIRSSTRCKLRQIHRLFEAVADRLVDKRMIGNLPVAGNVLEAGRGVRKYRRHEVVGLHALQLRRHLASAAVARHRQRNRRVPAPAGLKDRRIEKRLHEDVAHRRGCRYRNTSASGKRVLRAERQQHRVFRRRGLELEVELTAEPLAQCQRPGAVHAAAEWRMQHELHAAGFVEEALNHERRLRRHDAEHATSLRRCSRSVPAANGRGTSVAVSLDRASPIGAGHCSRPRRPRD